MLAGENTRDYPVSARDGQVERGLALKLAGTAERRALERDEIERMARAVDFEWLAAALDSVRLLPLLGSRLVASADGAVPESFRERLDVVTVHARRRAALVEQVALMLVRDLQDRSIPVVVLKGPHLAERLHLDAGMRTSNDIDLLVQPEDFHEAIAVLERTGYRNEAKAPWIGDLPLFETSLRADDDWRPPIDLHWRLHWHEDAFSRNFVLRNVLDGRRVSAPHPLDELAALLLFWCRDGLAGLRHAADVAAWWDRYGQALGPYALDEAGAAYPSLRRTFTAAVLLAQRAVGVPADRLMADIDRPERRTRLALRFANLVEPASLAQAQAGVVAVDALLSPRRTGVAFLRRHLLLPGAVIDEIYGLPGRAWARRALRRASYAARRAARLVYGMAALLRVLPR